jgi:hypothetical protein
MDIPHRRYVTRTALFMGIYTALNIGAIAGVFDDVGEAGHWGLAAAVALPVAAQIWATLALIRDSDEFVRALIAKRFIIASGAAMALFSAWGFMESYAHAPHAPGFLIAPLFWGLFGLVSPFVRHSH